MRYQRTIKSCQTRELRVIARKAGIAGWSSMARAELILALQLPKMEGDSGV